MVDGQNTKISTEKSEYIILRIEYKIDKKYGKK